MNTPYSSSGASSRAHYALVRRVEEARSQKVAESYLRDEVQLMRRRFALSPMSTSEIRISLIMLMYCLTTSYGSISRPSLEFAIPSALHLAEAGTTLTEKRVGYLFCDEVIPREHGMRLMLINTIRKDLESRHPPRMSLALRSVIAVPFSEVVPAVIELIMKAISHSSQRVKSLSIKALMSLASVDPEILTQERIVKAVEPRLHDGDETVVKAALDMCLSLSIAFPNILEALVDQGIGVLRQFSRGKAHSNHSSVFIQRISQMLCSSAIENLNSAEILELALRTLKISVKKNNYALGFEAIRLISQIPIATSIAYFSSQNAPTNETSNAKHLSHPMESIKHLLSSQSLNDHYTFLSYLSILPVQLWTGPPESDTEGNAEETSYHCLPLALNQWEVERIITFMDSSDEHIRILTLSVLMRVSSTIIQKSFEGRFSQLSSSAKGPKEFGALGTRLLEMADALCSAIDDEGARGRMSARKYYEICNLCKRDSVSHEILEHAVRTLRKGKSPIGQPFVTNWALGAIHGTRSDEVPLTTSDPLGQETSSVDSGPFFIDPNAPSSKAPILELNWTLMLVFVTFVCEHAGFLPRDDIKEVMSWLVSYLDLYPPTMQEPIILCIIRLLALFDNGSEIDGFFTEAITVCSVNSTSKLFKRYCDAFLLFSNDLTPLKTLIGDDTTLSQIPEVVTKLDSRPADAPAQVKQASPTPTPSKPPASNSTPLTSASLAQSQLRYTAYDSPQANADAKARVNSFSTLSTSSRRSTSQASSAKARLGEGHIDLTKTITAGDLALAEASGEGLLLSMTRKSTNTQQVWKGNEERKVPDKVDLVKKVDLISLDSPFLSEPILRTASSSSHGEGSGGTSYASLPETNFDVIWAECEASGNSTRGWLDAPLDSAVLRLQGIGLHIDVVPIDDAPFQGELKVLIKEELTESKDGIAKVAAIRLRDGEEGSCLWQMRSSDHALLLLVKQALCE